ncbi:MAG TPA: excisionase family DNA-binding protein [Candidatus Angelobacter sp.]|nr:excisionase family DNA-binding protein [Candidatus Angelobacter sp.]
MKNDLNNEQEITAVEAARRLGVGLDYLYSLLWTGKLKGHKVGKQWRIPAEAIQARMKQRGE